MARCITSECKMLVEGKGSVLVLTNTFSSKELQSFMSQHRKNSTRGKVIDKKWFIRDRRWWDLQAGGREGATPWEVSGLQLYHQRKCGVGKKQLSSSLLSRWHASTMSSSSRLGRGVFFLVPTWSSQGCKNYFWSLYNEHLPINYCLYLCRACPRDH